MNAFGVVGISRRLGRHWCINGGFDPTHPREVAWAVGAFLLVRRVAFNQVGGFDQAHWMYVEDLDLGWRLRRDGWAIRYEPAARIHHAESASTAAAWGDERYARWHASTYAWLLRRRGSAITRLVAGLNVVGFFVRAVVHAAAAVGGSKRSSQARRAALDTARAHSVGLRSRSLLMRVR